MDRSYSLSTYAQRPRTEPPKKRIRRAHASITRGTSDFTYRCIKCDGIVTVSHIILCPCGSRVVRKEKTKKEQTYVCR